MGIKIVADDYGMAVEINHAISELIDKKIVSKISVMANEYFDYSMNDIGKDAEIGLHVNFTTNTKNTGIEGEEKTSLLKLLYIIYIKRLNMNYIIDKIKHQSDILENKGFNISYMDTHQHIHIIPRVLESLIIYAKNKGIDSIRCLTMEKRYILFYLYSLMRFGFFTQIPKMVFLYFMGTIMKSKLDKAKINYCKNLILMPLATGGDYSGLLKDLLNKFKDKDAELIIHPSLETKTIMPDNYSNGRYIEYRSILSQMKTNHWMNRGSKKSNERR